ncbi:MAG: hypothetical protein ACRDDI_13440 [Aeromonas veronii]
MRLQANPKKFPPNIIAKAQEALKTGFRRPVNASHGKWQQISVGYRHRLLVRGDTAELMTHETMNQFMGRKGWSAS